MRTIILAIIGCFILMTVSVSSYAADRVGYINLQRLVNESEMGKAAKNDLMKIRSEKQASLKAKLKALTDLKAEIDKKDSQMSQDEKREKTKTLNRLYKEYQRDVADAKEEIANDDRELVARILKKADGALKKVAKKKKYAIILKDPNAIGYLDPEVDITDAVLKELNK
ncbi:OmpH family outer membrane protein [Thermodesulfobacteriota bacterium]